MTKSLTMNMKQSMTRANSFHHDSPINQPNMATVQENEGTIDKSETLTYRTSNDYYLDEDELILPLFPDEQPFLSKSVRLPKSPNKLEALDSMVISTTHNVSSKLCQAAAKIIRKAAQHVPDEDEDQALTLETVTYLLEDIHLPSNSRSRTSSELAGRVIILMIYNKKRKILC